MTRDAIPDGTGPVIRWACPACDQPLVATTELDPQLGPAYVSYRLTMMVGYKAVRHPEGEQDGVPCYGPPLRELRGKGPRRAPDRSAEAAAGRALWRFEDVEVKAGGPLTPAQAGSPGYAPIREPTFDAPCDNCGERLRFRVPNP